MEFFAAQLDRNAGELDVLTGSAVECGGVLYVHVNMRKIGVAGVTAIPYGLPRGDTLAWLDGDASTFEMGNEDIAIAGSLDYHVIPGRIALIFAA